MTLPDYPLELQKALMSEDQAAHVTVHNLNMDELVEYINRLRDYVASAVSVETSGITAAQARTIIESQKVQVTLPVAWPSSTMPIMDGTTQIGTMTRTNNPDGSASIAITNVKNTRKILVQVQSFDGQVVRPRISITNSFITIHFQRREDIDPTAGHSDQNTDPNIKRVIIF